MNKKKLIILAPCPTYGGSVNLLEAINMHSKRFEAEGYYMDDIPYNFLSENQKERWNNIDSIEVLHSLCSSLYNENTYFFGVSGRSLDMIEMVYKIDFCKSQRHGDMISLVDSFEGEVEPVKLSREALLAMCLIAKKEGFWDFKTALAIALPHSFMTVPSKQATQILREYSERMNDKIAFWWTDTTYRENAKSINEYIDYYGIQTFAMLDLTRLSSKSLPLMQTYDLSNEQPTKNKNFTVIHTPGLRESDKKGSDLVRGMADKMPGIDIKIYGKDNQVSNKTMLREKSKSHVCIDKISETCGGLGKSGLEAMIYGVPTICSLQDTTAVGRYSGLPAINVRDEEQLIEVLQKLSGDKQYYDEVSRKTKEWTQVLSYENIVKYLDEVLYNG